MVMIKPKIKDHGRMGKSKVTVMDTGVAQRNAVGFEWGMYFWKKADGHLLSDGEGRFLNIPSVKGDVTQLAKIRNAARDCGHEDGTAWFFAGGNRATDEEYEEQVQRLEDGLIPSLNDIGAVAAAKMSLETYGDIE